MQIKGVYHININCSDLERSMAFYEMLGYRVDFGNVDAQEADGSSSQKDDGLNGDDVRQEMMRALGLPREATPRGVIMTLGDNPYTPRLDLICWNPRTQPPGKPYPHLENLGIARVCLWTDDWEGDLQRLRDNGVAFVANPTDFILNGDPCRILVFKDPDGTFIELVDIVDEKRSLARRQS